MSDMKEHVKEVEKFEKSSLSRTDTVEKIILPDAGAIKAEKNEQKHRAGIENFYKGDLRKSQTVEKNPLPTKEDIEAEKQAN